MEESLAEGTRRVISLLETSESPVTLEDVAAALGAETGVAESLLKALQASSAVELSADGGYVIGDRRNAKAISSAVVDFDVESGEILTKNGMGLRIGSMEDVLMEYLLKYKSVSTKLFVDMSNGEFDGTNKEDRKKAEDYLRGLGLEEVPVHDGGPRISSVFAVPGTTVEEAAKFFFPSLVVRDGKIHITSATERQVIERARKEAERKIEDLKRRRDSNELRKVWLGRITTLFESDSMPDLVTTGEVVRLCGADPSPDGKDNKEIAWLLKEFGFTHSVKVVDGKKHKAFLKPEKQDEPDEPPPSDPEVPAEGPGDDFVHRVAEDAPEDDSVPPPAEEDPASPVEAAPEAPSEPPPEARPSEPPPGDFRHDNYMPGGWEGVLDGFLAGRSVVTVAEAVFAVLGRKANEYGSAQSSRVARAISERGFEQRTLKKNRAVKVYLRGGLWPRGMTEELYTSCPPPPDYVPKDLPRTLRVRVHDYEEAVLRLTSWRTMKRVEVFPTNFDVDWQMRVLEHLEKVGAVVRKGERLDTVYLGDLAVLPPLVGEPIPDDLLEFGLRERAPVEPDPAPEPPPEPDRQQEVLGDPEAAGPEGGKDALIIEMYNALQNHRDEIQVLRRRMKGLEERLDKLEIKE